MDIRVNNYLIKQKMKKQQNEEETLFQRDSFSMDQICKLQAMYDQINEQNQSYRESLLVSPHYSKYDKEKSKSPYLHKLQFNSHQNNDLDDSLSEYIRPFNFEQLAKTQTKQKLKIKKQIDINKKTEHSWDESPLDSKCVEQEKQIAQLRRTLEERDSKINLLQKQIVYMLQVNPTLPTVSMMSSPASISEKKHCSCQMQNLQKQVIFLTKNNQQLFEEVYRVRNHCKKMQKVLHKSLLYGRELSYKLKEFENNSFKLLKENKELRKQKEEMIKNYEQEIKLFMKMKKIWKSQSKQDNNEKENEKLRGKKEFHKKETYY